MTLLKRETCEWIYGEMRRPSSSKWPNCGVSSDLHLHYQKVMWKKVVTFFFFQLLARPIFCRMNQLESSIHVKIICKLWPSFSPWSLALPFFLLQLGFLRLGNPKKGGRFLMTWTASVSPVFWISSLEGWLFELFSSPYEIVDFVKSRVVRFCFFGKFSRFSEIDRKKMIHGWDTWKIPKEKNGFLFPSQCSIFSQFSSKMFIKIEDDKWGRFHPFLLMAPHVSKGKSKRGHSILKDPWDWYI